jgi:hypothetical protein
MARFAQKVKTTAPKKVIAGKKTVNHQGGVAYELGAEEQLATFLLTNFLSGGFYQTASDQHARLVELIKKVDPLFAAKAAIFARDQFGMRTVTHVVGARLPENVKGEPWMKNALASMIVRPDDAVEMMAYHKTVIGGPVPNSLKKGIQLGLSKFNAYQMAKWNKGGKFNLVDTINLVTGGNKNKFRGAVVSDVANGLVRNELETPDTWETKLSEAGRSEDAVNAKAEAWVEMVNSGSIGHMALVMNLRNIMQAAESLDKKEADKLGDKVVELLSNEKRVLNSRVFPFRYITAKDEIAKVATSNNKLKNRIIEGLNKALEISVQLIPEFSGNTLVAIDYSGSMTGARVGGDKGIQRTVADVAAQMAAAIYKKNHENTDVVFFAGEAKDSKYVNPNDSLLTVIQGFRNQIGSGGWTNFEDVFNLAGKKKVVYDRIIIISDMQNGSEVLRGYTKYLKTSPDVYVHMLDLAGYGTSALPTNNARIATYAGFSDKVFDIMAQAEEDPKALVNRIKEIELV